EEASRTPAHPRGRGRRRRGRPRLPAGRRRGEGRRADHLRRRLHPLLRLEHAGGRRANRHSPQAGRNGSL
ncbi:MAG: hypothetical protein AVDCRST_MAG02-3287, partial [uncultured Rubrobacteraceae bacterium]